MSTLLLSLLLIVLIALGLVMGHKVKETFEGSVPPAAVAPTANASIAIPAVVTMTPPQVDTIQRGLQEQQASDTRKPLGPGGEEKHRCPDCPRCPDMSKYIRMDEIPCWNCTLP
jgi:hypothetical protein